MIKVTTFLNTCQSPLFSLGTAGDSDPLGAAVVQSSFMDKSWLTGVLCQGQDTQGVPRAIWQQGIGIIILDMAGTLDHFTDIGIAEHLPWAILVTDATWNFSRQYSYLYLLKLIIYDTHLQYKPWDLHQCLQVSKRCPWNCWTSPLSQSKRWTRFWREFWRCRIMWKYFPHCTCSCQAKVQLQLVMRNSKQYN